MADYLLHSMSYFKPIFEKVFTKKEPQTIVEIGSEYGGSTKVLLEYAVGNDAHVNIIDPFPYVDLEKELSEYKGNFTHIKELSTKALDHIQNIDMAVIDGDHNYYTVSQELSMIIANSPKAWILMHDVCWPCGYRDMYYNPETIPSDYLHEYTYEDGVGADNELIKEGGFTGAGYFAWAKKSGGEKNGVKKAIEDFLEKNTQYLYYEINAVMGLGLIVPKADKLDADEIMKPYQNELIDNLEKNRIELYLKVIELQNMQFKKNEKQNSNLLFRVVRKFSNLIGYRPFT